MSAKARNGSGVQHAGPWEHGNASIDKINGETKFPDKNGGAKINGANTGAASEPEMGLPLSVPEVNGHNGVGKYWCISQRF